VVKRKNKGFYEEYRKEGQGKDRLFDKKSSILKFEIVAIFCHYAEILGAFFIHVINQMLIDSTLLTSGLIFLHEEML
jgi:hypothetical protein